MIGVVEGKFVVKLEVLAWESCFLGIIVDMSVVWCRLLGKGLPRFEILDMFWREFWLWLGLWFTMLERLELRLERLPWWL